MSRGREHDPRPAPSAAAELAPNEVRAFYAPSACVADPERAARCLSLLSDDERERHARFHFERDRHSYLAAHALVREVLGELLAVDPRALRFAAQPKGRPELVVPQTEPSLRFNLSHTRGLVACAVARVHDIGIDVEHVDRTLDLVRLAESVFSETERSALFALPSELQRERFFQLWTLKEAYIKAVGDGLSLPLRSINIELARPRPTLWFSPPLTGDPSRYFFDVRSVAPAFALALAVDAPVDVLHVSERLPGA